MLKTVRLLLPQRREFVYRDFNQFLLQTWSVPVFRPKPSVGIIKYKIFARNTLDAKLGRPGGVKRDCIPSFYGAIKIRYSRKDKSHR